MGIATRGTMLKQQWLSTSWGAMTLLFTRINGLRTHKDPMAHGLTTTYPMALLKTPSSTRMSLRTSQ
jgi:hypothetical protein